MNPAWHPEQQARELDVWAPPRRLLQEPDLVPAIECKVAAVPRVGRLGALRGVAIRADFYLEVVQRRAELRLEEQVEDVGPRLLRLVQQEPRAAAC